MISNQHPKNTTEIFSGAFLSKRNLWRRSAQLLPSHSCLLIYDHRNVKQTKIMEKIAQLFQNKGRKVYIWKQR